MKATESPLLSFLRRSPQFVIPIYQRTYSWKEKQCRQLWDDILRCGNDEEISTHFIGSIVYIEKGFFQVINQPPLWVIDGQQRLTTVTLLLAALADILGDSEPVDGFSRRKIRNYYLLNPEEKDERNYKLLLSRTDKSTLTAIVDGIDLPSEKSVRVTENYSLFKNLLASQSGDIESVCKGIAKLIIVSIALERGGDNPQLIFESMNSTGKELSQADLILNFILMGLEPEIQKRLYENYWHPMKLEFGQEGYDTHFDGFMRYYLIMKTSTMPRYDKIYDAYKNYAQNAKNKNISDEELIKDICKFAAHFCKMAFGAETDKKLGLAFHDIRELKADITYPLLLELYDDYASDTLPKEDFLEIVRLIESYVFRRAICEIPTASMNKTFTTFSKSLNKECYLESVKAHFLLMHTYRRFPKDDEFRQCMQTRDLYNFRSRSYWLRRFENSGKKEIVDVNEYTIEHIMPQNKNLPEPWKKVLGPEWERVHGTWLHKLGNLTLTGYNSEYSDRPFNEKRDMKDGFKDSPLRVNKDLGGVDTWNEDAIISRAEKLAAEALSVWVAPKLSSDILSAYQPKAVESATYSIDDYPHLQSANILELFEAVQKEVLALDPCVTQNFRKHYIAYVAETNFVDIAPQASQLQLSLNLKFAEISDPRGLCRDVSAVGKWGNGDVQVNLNEVGDIPYVIGLVRQSLERQLGSGDET